MEYNKCVLCQRTFSAKEEADGKKLMILSSECLHLIHKQCFSENAIMMT